MKELELRKPKVDDSKVQGLENQLQKKSKENYDLTVRLGCLELENKDLKAQIEDKMEVFESRLDSSRFLIAE